MTVEKYLQDSINDVSLRRVDEEEREDIMTHRDELKELLQASLALDTDKPFILSGSYARSTILKPKTAGDKFDIDLFMIANPYQYNGENLDTLYKEVFSLLKNSVGTIEITHVEKQRRSVKVEFGSDFHIDVAPAVTVGSQYAVYDTRLEQPLKSNPEIHQELITRKNATTAAGKTRRFIPLVRLLKAWKRNNFPEFKSFHLEMITLKAIPDNSITSFSQGAGLFFENVLSVLEEPLLDPANEENLIDIYLDEKQLRHGLVSVLKKNIALAELAIEAEENGEQEEALELWTQVLTKKAPEPARSSINIGTPAKAYGQYSANRTDNNR